MTPQPRMTPAPDRFRTVVGQPKIIALKFRNGKPIQRTGNVMYSLTSGETAFFPPEVAAEIDALYLIPGEPFEICHHGGPRWSVERVHEPQPPASQPKPSPSVALNRSHPSPSVPPPAAPVNGAGETAAQILASCYPDAIEIALGAIQLAKARGLMIAPSFEDIRSTATTLFIQRSRA